LLKGRVTPAAIEVANQITMPQPNFLIIGAMKSGTTSLYRYLEAHPEVCLSGVKEPGFFVEERAWSQGWEWYDSLFQPSARTKAVGEGSTHYTKYPLHERVAEKIAQHLPAVKLIYIMREPVARSVSHYWHMYHHWHETRSMLRAMKEESQYVDFSCYAMQLEQYFRHFPREQFYFASFERLKETPRDVVRECFEFLGVDETFVPHVLGQAFNESPPQVRKTRGLVHRIRWSPWWTRIAPYCPARLKQFGKQLEFTRVERPRETPQAVSEYLRPIFADENQRLFELIGQQFTEWKLSETTNVASGKPVS
jgi:hypothetical protein